MSRDLHLLCGKAPHVHISSESVPPHCYGSGEVSLLGAGAQISSSMSSGRSGTVHAVFVPCAALSGRQPSCRSLIRPSGVPPHSSAGLVVVVVVVVVVFAAAAAAALSATAAATTVVDAGGEHR